MEKEIKVGLIGYGYASKTFHAPLITSVPNLRLVKVVERKNTLSKERYPWVEVVDSVQNLYEDDSIQLIVVTTPSTNHYEFVKAALLSGKHVVVEKPFTVTVAEADELIALSKQQDRVLSVFHNRRWDGDFLTLQEILRQGMVGEVRTCEFHWDGFDPVMYPGNWRETAGPGTGIVYDLASHFLDQALQLFGMPNALEADIRIQREGALAHDYFDISLHYEEHLKVHLKSSRYVREMGPRFIIHGTKGSFTKYSSDPQELALIHGQTPLTLMDWGEENKEHWGKLNTSVGNLHIEGIIETLPGNYLAFYHNIYEHLTNQAELVVKPEEARNVIGLIELALQSHKEGRKLSVVTKEG